MAVRMCSCLEYILCFSDVWLLMAYEDGSLAED